MRDYCSHLPRRHPAGASRYSVYQCNPVGMPHLPGMEPRPRPYLWDCSHCHVVAGVRVGVARYGGFRHLQECGKGYERLS